VEVKKTAVFFCTVSCIKQLRSWREAIIIRHNHSI